MRPYTLAIALASTLLGGVAHAQDAAQLESYRRIATEGQEAFNRGDYAEARRVWQHARSVLPNPRVYALLGRAAQAVNDHVDAVRMFRLALSAPDNGNPLTAARRQEVETVLLPQSLGHVGELLLELEPADAAVTVDGQPASVEDGSLLLPTGTYALVVRRPGHREHQQTLRVLARAREPLRVVLEAEAGASTVVSAAPNAGAPAGPDLIGPIALFGVAGAGLVVFAIGGGLTVAEDERLADSCGARASVDCPDDALSDLHTFAAIGDVGWIVAAAAGLAGVIWLAVSLGSAGERAQASRIAPWAAPGAGGLVVAGRWGER